jgi:hypothetical protein
MVNRNECVMLGELFYVMHRDHDGPYQKKDRIIYSNGYNNLLNARLLFAKQPIGEKAVFSAMPQ